MTGRLVIDASAALHLVLRTEWAPRLAGAVAEASLVLAPTLFASEVANGLWKYVRSGAIDLPAAMEHREEAIGLVDTFAADADLPDGGSSSAASGS